MAVAMLLRRLPLKMEMQRKAMMPLRMEMLLVSSDNLNKNICNSSLNIAIYDTVVITETKETGVKRKSAAADNGDAEEKTTPEKKAKVAEEQPSAEAEEAAA